jgi:hypothetical protein
MSDNDRIVRVQYLRCPWVVDEEHWILVEWGTQPEAVYCHWYSGDHDPHSKAGPIHLGQQRLVRGMVSEAENDRGWTRVKPLPYDEALWKNLNNAISVRSN